MFSLNQFPLNFARNSLEPYISERAIGFHYDKHLGGYINNLNGLINDTEFQDKDLIEIIKKSSGKIFNNAAQTFNHDFFFKCLKKDCDKSAPDEIAELLPEFKAAAAGLFGSGWAWICRDKNGKLIVETTVNADTPIAHEHKPILTIDVWEHAYYLDYQNRRADFIDAFVKYLINWDFIMENLK
ncbi:MAG: superoxide dismutase [Alphaproteobacteria bacterium]|jgi:Fe-Mn family superoxide dismutase